MNGELQICFDTKFLFEFIKAVNTYRYISIAMTGIVFYYICNERPEFPKTIQSIVRGE